ncbi:MAG: acyltransferase [Planococcaceae bacterium]|nr:acyltransferase [Planococcaceae bacterium]
MSNLTNTSVSGIVEPLNTLTSFRFIAAFMVFLFHAGIWKEYQLGYLGVTFFFVLSGFILAYNYKEKFNTLEKPKLIYFYIARIAKIYPIHFLTFFFAIPYYFLVPLNHPPLMYVFQGVTNILLIQSFIPVGNVSFNGVSWSLSNELFFYVMFPFLLVLTIKFVKKVRTRILLVVVLWVTFIVIFSLIPQAADEGHSLSRWIAYFFPVTRLFDFFVGVIFGLVFSGIKNKVKNTSKFKFSFFEISSIVLSVVVIFYSPMFPQNLRYSLLILPFWTILIFVFAFQKGILSRIISNKVLIYLGEVSFSFYMIHNLVIIYAHIIGFDFTSVVVIIGCLLTSIFLSMVMYRYYEEPMRKKMRLVLTEKYNKKLINNKTKVDLVERTVTQT